MFYLHKAINKEDKGIGSIMWYSAASSKVLDNVLTARSTTYGPFYPLIHLQIYSVHLIAKRDFRFFFRVLQNINLHNVTALNSIPLGIVKFPVLKFLNFLLVIQILCLPLQM